MLLIILQFLLAWGVSWVTIEVVVVLLDWVLRLSLGISTAWDIGLYSGLAIGLLRVIFLRRWNQLSQRIEKASLSESEVGLISGVYVWTCFALMVVPGLLALLIPFGTLVQVIAFSNLVLMALCAQKFVDAILLTSPRKIYTHVVGCLFLVAATAQIYYSLPSQTAAISAVSRSFLLAFMLLFYGFASYAAFEEKGEELLETHPQYFLALQHQGLYSIVLALGIALSQFYFAMAGNLAHALLAVVMIGAIVVVVPYFRQYGSLVHKLMTLHEDKAGRKLLLKAKKDSWQTEVKHGSYLAGLMAPLLALISVLGVYASLVLLQLAVVNVDVGLGFNGVFLLSLCISPILYSTSKMGWSFKYSQVTKRLKMLNPVGAAELEHSFEFLTSAYFATSALFVGLGPGLLGQLDADAAFAVASMSLGFAMLCYWISTHSFGAQEYTDGYLRKMKRWFTTLTTILWIMDGLWIAFFAKYLRVTPVLYSALGGAVALMLIIGQLYFTYIKAQGMKKIEG